MLDYISITIIIILTTVLQIEMKFKVMDVTNTSIT